MFVVSHDPQPCGGKPSETMNIESIRAALAQDKPTIGTWLQFPSSEVAELLARAGYDWVAADMEHGTFGRTGLTDIFRAIECGGAAPFARLAEATRLQIKSALEAGRNSMRPSAGRPIPAMTTGGCPKSRCGRTAAWASAGPMHSARRWKAI